MKSRIALQLVGMGLWILLTACAGTSANKATIAMSSESHKIDYPEEWEGRSPFRFLVVGDTQNPKPGKDRNDAERLAIYQRFSEALADSVPVVHIGDIVENGSRQGQWRQFFDDIFWDELPVEQKRMFFPIPGNHEYKTHFFDYGGGDLGLYYERFPHIRSQRYYFFTHGDACFVFMDAGRNGAAKLLAGERWQNGVEEQLEWLDRTVLPFIRKQGEEVGLRRVFLFYHKPGYATPVYVKNRQSVEVLKRFDDFNKENGYGFEIFAFAGHVHTFAHIVHDYNGDGQGEIDQFTIGGGGGTQRGGKYFRKVERVEDLDRYRLGKYREGVDGEGLDRELFDRLRLDNRLFGYMEVVMGDRVEFLFHRFDRKAGEFYIDYEFSR